MCFFWVSSSIVTPRTCYKRFFSHFNEMHLLFCRPLIKFASIWLGAENAGDNFVFFRVLIFLLFSIWNRSECLVECEFSPWTDGKTCNEFQIVETSKWMANGVKGKSKTVQCHVQFFRIFPVTQPDQIHFRVHQEWVNYPKISEEFDDAANFLNILKNDSSEKFYPNFMCIIGGESEASKSRAETEKRKSLYCFN